MNNNLSKFISLILRHKPEVIGINLDEHGYADVQELIKGINNDGQYEIDFKSLKEIVDIDNKMRYSFNEDFTKIRANQGHSINVDVELEKTIPPTYLYHGTATRFEDSINRSGLKHMHRVYVHLSKDEETAYNVGKRHGKPKIFKIDAYRMWKDGYIFYISKNGVYLTKNVPKQYLIEEV